MIDGNTKVVGLIGNPVEHSLSPVMHNAAFKELNLNYIYLPFMVEDNKLKNVIDGAESLNIKGLNVTIPHKINIIPYLDELDPIAKLIGAVNTIDLKNKKGYNTDGIGALKAIEEIISLKNKKIVITGAGGSARAISFQIANENIDNLVIINRNEDKAKSLSEDILKSNLNENINYNSLDNLKNELCDADIFIDTTPLGLKPNDKPIATHDILHEDLIVNDIVYNPIKTPLLKEAEIANSKTISGIKMLLYQGAESFKIWTGINPPIDVMEEVILKHVV
ncbi:shikimate dehydrogenase [Methanobrevibacter sp. OttesenSCG-928-K11]|nr:shikimate dehydrogenase [Methanobrevibacter sp. OttesenSCG-928-K11]MDL2270997.1 shikimate dehydrogenase [Methanobrevibacter sp. OttesenSCG-928-I08]